MAAAGPPGVTVFCDPTLRPLLRLVGAQALYQVAVLSAPAPLMLAQIARNTRNDVLITDSSAMDRAGQMRLIDPATRLDGFATTLVLAGLPGWHGDPAKSRIAVTDATVASGLDGRAVLAANNITPAAIQGAANTGDVAFLVLTGAADAGLFYLTDVRAEPKLAAPGPALKADPKLTNFAAAVNAKAPSPNAHAFMQFLRDAAPMLRTGGLSMT